MIKVLFEIYKVLGRIGIKPKDVIGMGGDIVKMGKSLFNTRPNPKLLTFIEKNQKIPTKILENIKIHARTLKNTSESQKNLFLENIKSIQNAKTGIKPEIVPKKGMFDNIFTKMHREVMGPPKVVKPSSPVTGVKQPATSVREQGLESFKGWKPTVIKGGKDGLAAGGRAKFGEGTGLNLYPRASIIQGGETVGYNKDIDVDVRDVDYGITGLYEGNNWFAGAEIDKGNVKVDVTRDGETLFKDSMGKDEVVNFIAGFGDPNDEKFQVKVDDDFENVSVVLRKTFATGGIANHFRVR